MTDAARSASLSLLGRVLRVTGAPTVLARWLDASWRFDEHALADAGYEIALDVVEQAPSLPVSAAASATRLHGKESLAWRGSGDEWWTGDATAGVRLRCDASGARIDTWGWRAPSERLYAALYLALCEALRASGLLSLHAAVIARDGAATALCGRSGVGKSTTLLRAVAAGWSPLAEALSWLEPASLRLSGWDRGVRLWPVGQARLAEHSTAEWEIDVDGKRFLPYERLSVARVPRATLERVLVLHRDPSAESGEQGLDARDAVRALWESTGVPLTATGRARASDAIGTLLPRVRIAQLVLGATAVRL